MNGKQLLAAYIGVFLIALTIWQHWRSDIASILLTSEPIGSSPDAGPKIYQPTPGNNPEGGSPYTVQPGAPGAAPGQNTIIPVIP